MQIAGDSIRVLKALLTNQLARFSSATYMRMTQETGRGEAAGSSPEEVGQYFVDCFFDYFDAIGVPRDGIAEAIADRVVLEYGPGDILGVALMLAAYGARKVYCVDRFALLQPTDFNVAVMRAILVSLGPDVRACADDCFRKAGDPGSGFAADRIEYLVRPDGLSGLEGVIDMVVSRAVLEHVNDLGATFRDMSACLRAGGTAVHLVDLRSHGLHRRNPLDFLEWSAPMWRRMYSHKGVPNRFRINQYREIIEKLPFDVVALKVTQRAAQSDLEEIRECLPVEFRKLSDDDLACLGFWLEFRKRAGQAGGYDQPGRPN